ncbi:BON domain-containing protein [Chryseobacterium wanjuense]
MEAENAAKKVAGLKALVENIEVKFPNSLYKTDAEVAKETLNALKANYSIPDDNIKVKVEDGKVTLEGELPWNYQKEEAEHAVKYLSGVKGVINNIKIKSEVDDAIQKKTLKMHSEEVRLTTVKLKYPYQEQQ